MRGSWLMGTRGCGTDGGRMVRDGTLSSDGVLRRTLNSRLIDGSVWARESIGMPLAAMRRAASLGVMIERVDAVPAAGSSSLQMQVVQRSARSDGRKATYKAIGSAS